MNNFMIPTKLNRPKLEGQLIWRESLIDQMNLDSMRCIVVSCQTGFGKSTLVSQWLNQKEIQDANPLRVWYALDTYDKDPLVFFTYLFEGIRQNDPKRGQQLLALVNQISQMPMDRFIRMVLSQLYALDHEMIMVLDDYHHITESSIHEFLDLLVQFLSDKIKLVVISREKIPLQLNKIRLEGRLLEIGEADLKLTEVQVGQLNEARPELTHDLYRLTEGWAVGLKLAQISLKTSFMQGSGHQSLNKMDHVLLTQYLMEELFQTLTTRERDFLMLSAIPEHFSRDMCHEVFEIFFKDSLKALDQILDKNLFITRLGGDDPTFAYHQVFRKLLLEILRKQLGLDYPTRIKGVTLAIADWYMKMDKVFEATQLFLQEEDYQRASIGLEILWPPMDLHLTTHLWLELIDKCPEGLIKDRPVLAMAYAWVLIDNNRIDQVDYWLECAEKTYAQETLKSLKKKGLVADLEQYDLFSVNLLMAKAYQAAARGQIKDLFYYGHLSQDAMGHKTLKKYGIINMTMAFAHWHAGAYDEAESAIEKAIYYEAQYGQGINVDNFWMVRYHLWLHSHEFDLLKSKLIDHIQRIENHQGFPLILPTLYLLLAYSADFEGRHEDCKQLMKEAKILGGQMALNDFDYRYALLKCKILSDSGNLKEAKLYLNEAKQAYFPNPIPDFYSLEDLEVTMKTAHKGNQGRQHYNALLPEPLTVREMEVLELIESGMSNKEIGQSLFIALSTVKGYIQNIYGKLEVKRRTEAVAKAKDLNLL